MTYLLETARGFESDPSGSLSVGLVSAWPLTELAGRRRDSAGCLALRTTSNTRFNTAGATPDTASSTGVLHTDDVSVAQFEGSTTGSPPPAAADYTTNLDKMLYASLPYNFGDRSAMTFSAWVYVDSTYSATALSGYIAAHENFALTNGWYLRQLEDGGNQKMTWGFATSSSYSHVTSTTNLATSTWYHVACTWDGTTRSIYINGASEDSDTPAAMGAAESTSQLSFGRTTHATYPYTWHGRLCHAALWIKSLSAAEVLTLYNSGVPNRYKPWAAGG
jgi:hypothetical protein